MSKLGDDYIEIMIDSLRKKEAVLDEIMKMNEHQRQVLKDPNLTPEEFESVVDDKAKCIEELEKLDAGFEALFTKMRTELNGNKEKHASEIGAMQELIRSVTAKANDIRTTEMRNREEALKKFAAVRNQVKEVRTGHKIASQYYRNMLKLNYVDSQFLDNKR